MTDNSQQVDKAQRKILFKTALKLDWRGSTNPFTAMQGKRGKFPGIAAVILMNIFFSFMLTLMFKIVPSFFLGLVLASTGGMVVIAMQLLIEYSHIIISPEDYHVISPLPVNSKTYFQAKLYHLFTFVTILSLSISFFPAVVGSYMYGSFILFPIILVQFALVNYFTAFVIMNIYTFAMKIVNQKKIERILLYLQFIFIMMFYLGMQVIPEILKNLFAGSTTETFVWVKFLPSYALSSWYLLITDGWDIAVFTYLIVAILLLFGLYKLSASYLSLSYSESLNKIGKESVKKKSIVPKVIVHFWKRYSNFEERAVLSLIWSEFKHNTRFKMQMLFVFPMLIYVIFINLKDGYTMADPFLPITSSVDGGVLIVIMLSFIPYQLMMGIQFSKQWKAASVFYYTACNKTNIILASKKIVTLLFIIPICLLLTFFYWYMLHNVLHAFLYILFIIQIIIIGVNMISLISMRIPFAAELPFGGKFTLEGLLVMLIMPFVIIPILIINKLGFGGYQGWFIITISILLVNIGLWKLAQMRVRNNNKSRYFEIIS